MRRLGSGRPQTPFVLREPLLFLLQGELVADLDAPDDALGSGAEGQIGLQRLLDGLFLVLGEPSGNSEPESR